MSNQCTSSRRRHHRTCDTRQTDCTLWSGREHERRARYCPVSLPPFCNMLQHVLQLTATVSSSIEFSVNYSRYLTGTNKFEKQPKYLTKISDISAMTVAFFWTENLPLQISRKNWDIVNAATVSKDVFETVKIYGQLRAICIIWAILWLLWLSLTHLPSNQHWNLNTSKQSLNCHLESNQTKSLQITKQFKNLKL